MKTIRTLLIAAVATISFTSTAFADLGTVYFDHTYDYTFVRNDFGKEVGPILIIDTDGGSITAAHGIRIIIPETLYSLWEPAKTQLLLSGTAVTQGKIAAVVTPVYSDSLKEVYLPVLGDFVKGMDVSVSGLSMRTYRTANDKRRLALDLNGDHVGDVDNFRTISISSEIRNDATAPYPVKKLAVVKVSTGVKLTWIDSADYDLDRIMIIKKLNRNGLSSVQNFEAYATDQAFTDSDSKVGDSVVYELQSRDSNGNLSDMVSVSYTESLIVAPAAPIASEEPVVSTEESAQARILDRMKSAEAFKGNLSQSQLRSALYSTFASQIVMSFPATACSASKSHVLGQKCLQAAKKYGIIKTSVSKKMSKYDFVEMLLNYFAKQGTTLVTYSAPADLVCTGASQSKISKAYNSFINGQKLGFLPEGNFSCTYFKSLTRSEAINIADLFFVKNIQ